jgi:hypothetical protein
VTSTSFAMCTLTVCFLSLSTTSIAVDILIEQTDGLHLNHFGLRLCYLITAEQCLGMLFSREINLVRTLVGLSAVSKYWCIVELCTRSTTRMSKQWLLSTQLSTQSLLINLLPLLQNLHQHPVLLVTKVWSFSSFVLWSVWCGSSSTSVMAVTFR